MSNSDAELNFDHHSDGWDEEARECEHNAEAHGCDGEEYHVNDWEKAWDVSPDFDEMHFDSVDNDYY